MAILLLGLIESDWNLKLSIDSSCGDNLIGLIESDWNLKYVARIKSVASARINRIRLEFKVIAHLNVSLCLMGLIESDWNLK